MRYVFQSKRLGFRNWEIDEDLPVMLGLCSDKEVMKYFPTVLSEGVRQIAD